MSTDQVAKLLYRALETEKGGIQVYEAALRCVQNPDLKKACDEYLEQTQKHEQIVLETMETFGLDPDTETPGRIVVRHISESLVEAMELALQTNTSAAAELVACECIVEAGTRNHLNWELIHSLAGTVNGEAGQALRDAYEQVAEEEAEHLHHSTRWCRELWIKSLSMKAVLPPPKEGKDVRTAIEAEHAKEAREMRQTFAPLWITGQP